MSEFKHVQDVAASHPHSRRLQALHGAYSDVTGTVNITATAVDAASGYSPSPFQDDFRGIDPMDTNFNHDSTTSDVVDRGSSAKLSQGNPVVTVSDVLSGCATPSRSLDASGSRRRSRKMQGVQYQAGVVEEKERKGGEGAEEKMGGEREEEVREEEQEELLSDMEGL